MEGGFVKSTANAYLKACNRVVLFQANFDFAKSGSLEDIEKLQEKVKSYSEGTGQEKLDRAVKEVLQEKRQAQPREPAFKMRPLGDGEDVAAYIKLVEEELAKVVGQQVTIQLRIRKRRSA